MPAERPRTLRHLGPELGIMALAAGLLFVWLPTLPAVTMDEAWIFHRVRAISEGQRPIAGMTFYTGALHQYLMWPVFALFGYSVGALRAVAALANLGALGVFLALMTRLYRAPATGVWARRSAGLLLATTPSFIAMGRFGVELTALGPLLVLSGLLGLRVAAERGRRWPLAAALGGLLLGLATWNHVLFIVVPVSLGLSSLALYRGALLRHPALWVALATFVVGWSPQIWLVLAGERQSWGGAGAGMASSLDALIQVRLLGELPHLPGILEGNWDGSLVYSRFCGPNAAWVLPYPGLAVVALLIARLRAGAFARMTRIDSLLVLMPGLMVIGIVAISPGLSSRFLVIPVIFAVVLLARLAPRDAMGRAVLGLVVVANLTYLAINYYGSFRETGGVAHVYELGNQLLESSTTFVDTRQLYEELVAADFGVVLANEVISGPLSIHDWGRDQLAEDFWPLTREPPARVLNTEGGAAIVYHNGPLTHTRATEIFDVSDRNEIAGESTWRLDPRFDSRFRVFVLVDPNTTVTP